MSWASGYNGGASNLENPLAWRAIGKFPLISTPESVWLCMQCVGIDINFSSLDLTLVTQPITSTSYSHHKHTHIHKPITAHIESVAYEYKCVMYAIASS